jgi:hypothetical protein
MAGRHASQCRHDRADRHRQADDGRIESEPLREVEGSDDQRRHHHRGDKHAHREPRAQHGVTKGRQPKERRWRARLRSQEEACPKERGRQQDGVQYAEAAAPGRHGERVGRERQS